MTCECRQEELRRRDADMKVTEVERHLISAGFESGRYKDYRLNKWKTLPANRAAEKTLAEYLGRVSLDGRNWLYLHGGFGTGKTHLAIAAARQLAYDHYWRPEVCRWAEYCSRIQQSWQERLDTRWRAIHQAKVLVLDDIDKKSATEWALGQLYEMIEMRYVNQRPTIITANRKLSELAGLWAHDQRLASIGQAIVSRILGSVMYVIEFKGDDQRLPK